MYRQRAKNSKFSDFDIFSFGHKMVSCAKNYKDRPSSLFLGTNGLTPTSHMNVILQFFRYFCIISLLFFLLGFVKGDITLRNVTSP